MTALIRTTSLTGYPQLVQELGGDSAALARLFNIDLELLDNSNSVIPYRALIGLMEHSAEQLECPDFGLLLAERQSMMILGPLAFIAENSGSVGQALREIAKYMHYYSPGITLELDERSDPAHPKLIFEIRLTAAPRQRQTLELSLGVAYKALQMLYGSQFHPASVWFRCQTPLPQSRYHRYFGAHPFFGQSCNALVLRPEHLSKPIDKQNRQLHDTLVEFIHSASGSNPMDIRNQVEQLILRLLPTHRCTLPLISEQLGMRGRSLQRRLADHDLLFEDLVDSTRRELADRYLAEARMPMTQVAGLLGYAEQSSFNRACKRWHATSPKGRRKQLSQGDAGH